MPRPENQSLSSSWWNLSLSLSLCLPYGRAWSVAGYPEKCTHRYCADTKVVLRSKTAPSPAECAELLLPNNRFLISPQPKVFLGEQTARIPSTFPHPSQSVPSLSHPPLHFALPLSTLLISRRYCAPLFRQFCQRRIAGVIDKTSKSAAHPPNKIDSPSCCPASVRE